MEGFGRMGHPERVRRLELAKPVAHDLSQPFFEGKVDFVGLQADAKAAGHKNWGEWAGADAAGFNDGVSKNFYPDGFPGKIRSIREYVTEEDRKSHGQT